MELGYANKTVTTIVFEFVEMAGGQKSIPTYTNAAAYD
jgi:hypothetical protein